MDLPDLDMPFPARVNPHLDRAEQHGKTWARAMGIVRDAEGSSWAGFAWADRDIDSAIMGTSMALYYPEAPPEELELLTCWAILATFLDEHFHRAYQAGDLDAAREFVARLPAFTSELIGVTPPPSCPEENALADLWPRTAAVMSPAWRRRFARHIQDTCNSCLAEAAHLAQGWICDPIDYFAGRRSSIAQFWYHDLLEHASAAEIPATVHATGPVRRMLDATADIVALTNDIFSFVKETERDHEATNLLLSVRSLLGDDTGRALDYVSGLRTSRVRTFEHITATELPALADERDLSPAQRQALRRYAEGLQDQIAGVLEWHRRARGRYPPSGAGGRGQLPLPDPGPAGLGTSGLRLAAPTS